MKFGQRKAERVHFQHERIVNLMGVDGTWRRACVLKDVSARAIGGGGFDRRFEVAGIFRAFVNQPSVSSV
jgi:hypothetical protein